MGSKKGVINITKDIEYVKDRISNGTFTEPVKGAFKKELRKKPNYKKILKEDKNGVEKRHAMLIEDEKEISRKAYETLKIEEEERRIAVEERKEKGTDINQIINNIATNKNIMTPEETMEWLSNVVKGEEANANGMQVGMEQRIKAANSLMKCWQDFKPETPEEHLEGIQVNIKDLTDEDRVIDIASEVGLSKEDLDEIRKESRGN